MKNNIKMALKNRIWVYELDSPDPREGTMANFCEHCNELQGSTKGNKFLGKMTINYGVGFCLTETFKNSKLSIKATNFEAIYVTI
jgi:hypothetical protein